MKTEKGELGVDVLHADYVAGKLSELKDLLQRNNIRIEEIEEEHYETSEMCKEKVHEFVNEKLDIEGGVEING